MNQIEPDGVGEPHGVVIKNSKKKRMRTKKKDISPGRPPTTTTPKAWASKTKGKQLLKVVLATKRKSPKKSPENKRKKTWQPQKEISHAKRKMEFDNDNKVELKEREMNSGLNTMAQNGDMSEIREETVREKKKEIGDSDCGWIRTNRRRKGNIVKSNMEKANLDVGKNENLEVEGHGQGDKSKMEYENKNNIEMNETIEITERDKETVTDERILETVMDETVTETVTDETVTETVTDKMMTESVKDETMTETVMDERISERVMDEKVTETVTEQKETETDENMRNNVIVNCEKENEMNGRLKNSVDEDDRKEYEVDVQFKQVVNEEDVSPITNESAT